MPVAVFDDTRRTSADVVFDFLHDEIQSLRLVPGAKISEAEIAAQLGVSRQPVRDAFGRLHNLGLLLIRPQRVTVVQKFSLEKIASARFTRQALEAEVLHFAVAFWDEAMLPAFQKNLASQRAAMEAGDVEQFHELDLAFHGLLCQAADRDFAFASIVKTKSEVTRLCVLSLTANDEMAQLIEDHEKIFDCLSKMDEAAAVAAMRVHLSRLDTTIDAIYRTHAVYFSDEA